MNPTIQRYLPPLLVFGAAIFFGWPPSAPLDLGDDVIRASSVRWRKGDLVDLPQLEINVDPFEEVLVVSEELVEVEEVAVAVVPLGPPEQELQDGLQLDGFASMGGRTWAVLNGRPRLPGDHLETDGTNRHRCELVKIEADHVVVRCQETVTKIGVERNKRRAKSEATPEAVSSPLAADSATTSDDVAPPPSDIQQNP